MRIHSKYFIEEFCEEYDIEKLTDADDYVYCENRKGMYGIEEAGCIAYQNLVKNLMPFGYEPMKCTPRLWFHKTRRTTLTLSVDDFRIKHFTENDHDYLFNALKVH